MVALTCREEVAEYIEIGSLNGLFVLGRTIGFIGKLLLFLLTLIFSYQVITQYGNDLIRCLNYQLKDSILRLFVKIIITQYGNDLIRSLVINKRMLENNLTILATSCLALPQTFPTLQSPIKVHHNKGGGGLE